MHIVRLHSCSSTNDEATTLARAGAEHGTWVVAEIQTAGRGRQGRSWHSKGDNFYGSLIVRHSLPLERVPALGIAAGVGVTRWLASLQVQAAIKWPNDILAGDRKLAGILAESHGGAQPFAIIGIGLNVNDRDFPPAIADIATSLAVLLQRICDLDGVREGLCAAALRAVDDYCAGAFADTLDEAWSRSAIGAGVITFESGNQQLHGRALGLSPLGHLRVRLPDGKELEVAAGDVHLVRHRQ